MLSKPKLKQSDDPHDVLVVAPDVALVVPTDEELSKLAHTLRNPSAPQIRTGPEIRTGSELPAGATVPPVDATFRPSVGDVRAPGARRAARVFTIALLLAVCAGAADFAWQSYGDVARQMIDQWTPQRILTTLLPQKESVPSAQPTASAAAEPVPANTAPPPSQAPVQAAAQPEAPRLNPHRKPSRRSLPTHRSDLRRRFRRWRTTSQMRGRRSSNSRPASSSSRVASSSSRQASNKYPATSPRRRSRTRFRSRICGRRLYRRHGGRSSHAGRRRFRDRRRRQLRCRRKPPRLTCHGDPNRRRKTPATRRSIRTWHRCRGRQCRCAR